MRFCSLASKNKKISFEYSFIIISTEHTGSVSHLFCEKYSLPKKIPCVPRYTCTSSYKAYSEKISVLCGGTLKFERMFNPTSIKSLHLAGFQSSTSATAVTGLQIEPELILLEARESSTVTSHGTSVKPSGCF